MTAIPITSEGRALCGFVTQTNSVNTNKVRNIGWRDSGVADKMSWIWEENWGARATYTPTTITPPHLEKKKNSAWLWEILFPVRTIMPEKFLPDQKCHKTWMGLWKRCWKHLIVPFVCPFITFFFFFSATDFQFGRNTGISSCLLQQQ